MQSVKVWVLCFQQEGYMIFQDIDDDEDDDDDNNTSEKVELQRL